MLADFEVGVQGRAEHLVATFIAIVLADIIGVRADEEWSLEHGVIVADRAEHVARLPLRLEIGIFELELGGERPTLVELDLAADIFLVDARLVAVEFLVIEIAVHRPVITDDARFDAVAQRARQHAVELEFLVIEFIEAGHRALEFVGRAARRDVHCAGDRILAEQGRLRPAQHLDALHVDQRQARELVAAVIDAVDEHRDRLFEPLVVARGDAADRDAVGDRGLGDLQVRDRR